MRPRPSGSHWFLALGLVVLAACRDAAAPIVPERPRLQIATEVATCDPVANPDCRPRRPDPREVAALREAIDRIRCGGVREYLAWRFDSIRLYDADVGEYGDYHARTREFHVWSGLINSPMELTRTLIHEVGHSWYGYGEAQADQLMNQCY